MYLLNIFFLFIFLSTSSNSPINRGFVRFRHSAAYKASGNISLIMSQICVNRDRILPVGDHDQFVRRVHLVDPNVSAFFSDKSLSAHFSRYFNSSTFWIHPPPPLLVISVCLLCQFVPGADNPVLCVLMGQQCHPRGWTIHFSTPPSPIISWRHSLITLSSTQFK